MKLNLGQRLLIAAINKYQSKQTGIEKFRVQCNFEPSCSRYCKVAIERYGVISGLKLAMLRVSRCSDRDQVGTVKDTVP
jgi:putative component of membrane protein insertase Oxa1/YidC/SpoIIIJ protein YidD